MSKLRDWFSVNLVLASLPGLLSVAMWLLSALFVILLLYLKCPVCIMFTLRGGGMGEGRGSWLLFFSLVCGLCTVCHGFFALPLGIVVRLILRLCLIPGFFYTFFFLLTISMRLLFCNSLYVIYCTFFRCLSPILFSVGASGGLYFVIKAFLCNFMNNK